MDTAADYRAKARECENMAAEAGVPHSRAILLALAAKWREMAEEAAGKEAVSRSISEPFLSA